MRARVLRGVIVVTNLSPVPPMVNDFGIPQNTCAHILAEPLMSTVTIGEPAWLRLTPETALEPDLPICDPHHHIWAQRHEPPAYRRYLLPELAGGYPRQRA